MSATKDKPPYHGTRLRPLRVEDDLWDEAGEATAALGTDRSAVMRDALRRVVRRHKGKGSRDA